MSKSYHQYCGLARALDVVGERWTLLIVRELLLGRRRFSQLLAALQGITTNLLTDRLARLVSEGVIDKSPDGYTLTAAGQELEPALMALARWGGRYMEAGPQPDDRRSLAWALLSLKRRYPGGQRLNVGLEADQRSFELAFLPDGLTVREQRAAAPDLQLSGPEAAFFLLLFGQAEQALSQLEVVGELSPFLRAVGLSTPA